MKIKSDKFLSLAAALLLLPAWSYGLTLQESVLAASLYDSEISAARRVQQADSQQRMQGFASLLPVIELSGSWVKQDQPKASYAAGVTRHTASFNFTQPLFDITKYANWKRGDAAATYADIVLMQAEQKLIARVAEAFFRVLYQREVLNTALNAKRARQKQLSQTQLALKIGEGTRLDRDEAQASYDKAVAAEIAARNELDNAGMEFRRITGLSPDTIEALPLECAISRMPQRTLQPLLEQAQQQNISVQAALAQLDQSKAEVLAAHGAHLPVVTLQAAYGTNWSRAEESNLLDVMFGTTSKTRSSNIGINVSVPLFAGGSQLSRSLEAIHRRDSQRDLLLDAQRKARQETQSAWLALKSGLSQYQAEKQALASAKNKMESTTYGRKVGLRTIIDQLNAEQDYYNTLQDLAKVQLDYLVASIKLSIEIGELDYARLSRYDCGQSANQPSLNKQG